METIQNLNNKLKKYNDECSQTAVIVGLMEEHQWNQLISRIFKLKQNSKTVDYY